MCSFSSPLAHTKGRKLPVSVGQSGVSVGPLGVTSCSRVAQVAGLGTTREVELPLSNYKSTIFFYVQKLLQLSCNGAVKTDKLRRIWEPTYT